MKRLSALGKSFLSFAEGHKAFQKSTKMISFSLSLIFLLAACSNAGSLVPVTDSLAEEIEPAPTQNSAPDTPQRETTAQPTAVESDPIPQPKSPSIVETEQPQAGSSRSIKVDQMQQVYVPSGEFTMGADDRDAKISLEGGVAYPENPPNIVNLEGYWIDKYEVTTSQYALCVDNGSCAAPFAPFTATRQDYFGNPEYSNYPVMWVNWSMARTYCEWAGRRLPTEAEWEKAARGTDGRMYPWGNEQVTGELANFCDKDCPRTYADTDKDDGYADTAPVGSYPSGASPYGAMDMAGNVWEWNSTLIKPYPYDASDGREDLDATGERGWRGGPWSNGWWWMRSTLRYHSVPTYWYYNLGFRCAASE